MGLYIGAEYFQIVHYYYFCMGMFSFTAAVIFGFPYSILFMAFCVLNSGISWYVSWFTQKKMKRFVIIGSSSYMVSHVFLTVMISCMTIFMWYYGVFMMEFLIESIVQVNFFVFFLGMMWYILTRFDMVSGLFDYFDTLALRRAKKLILSSREKLDLKKLMTDASIKSYKPGTEPEIDSLLISIWKQKKSNLKENIHEFEMMMCENAIERLRNRIEKIKSKPGTSHIDQKMIDTYEKFIRDYEKDAVEYEKVFG